MRKKTKAWLQSNLTPKPQWSIRMKSYKFITNSPKCYIFINCLERVLYWLKKKNPITNMVPIHCIPYSLGGQPTTYQVLTSAQMFFACIFWRKQNPIMHCQETRPFESRHHSYITAVACALWWKKQNSGKKLK